MRRFLAGIAVAVVAGGSIGCGDNTQQLPPGPRMQAAAPTSGVVGCNFKNLNQLATHYFSGPEAKVVRTLISQMQAADSFTTAAVGYGFDVMVHISGNIAAGNADVTDATNLTNGLIACMYTAASGARPATFPEPAFSIATDPAQHGAYEVRGGAADLDTVVFNRPVDHPFSGIAPPPGVSWSTMLSGNPAPSRALIYGVPGADSGTYDWRSVPRTATFAPEAIVGFCINPDRDSTSLVHQEKVGLLPYVNALFMDLSKCVNVVLAPSPSPLRFARSAVRWGLDLLSPRPLAASSAVFIDGLAGTTGGLHSEFGPEKTDTVTLKFGVQPTDVQVNQAITPAVVVHAFHASTGASVANVSITLTAVNNNGTPATLNGTFPQVTDSAGNATFADLSETKTGAYVLVASGGVGGRPFILVLQATSDRFNVRP